MSSCSTTDLPILRVKQPLLAALYQHDLVLLSAPPGAGKSTGLPLWLLEDEQLAGKKIVLLQPRRIAAKSVANFLAQQLNEPVGQTVGYRIRNEHKSSETTRLEVMTDGVLTQIIQADPELTDIGLIIFDEFHQRSIHADLSFALARDAQQGFAEHIKLLLMSATIDSETIGKQFTDSPVIASEGRSFQVDFSYQPPSRLNDWRVHMLSVLRRWCIQGQDSALAFLPGSADIRFIANELAEHNSTELSIHSLYGDLPFSAQQKAIEACPNGHRKLVLCTNIAETSLTIDGISCVFDSGLEKVAQFDQARLTNRLVQQNTSRSSAVQRAGRAGRLMAGRCVRLFGQEEFSRRPKHSMSEIQQSDLVPVLMQVAKWGVFSCSDLPFVEQPNKQNEEQGWQVLTRLKITDSKKRLTAHGKEVAKLNSHPRFAHMLVTSTRIASELALPNLTGLACLLAAFLEEGDFFSPERRQQTADINQRLAELSNRSDSKIKRLLKQARLLANQLNIRLSNNLTAELSLLQYTGALLALSYPERVGQRRSHGESYLFSNGSGANANPVDSLFKQSYIVAAELMTIKGNNKVTLAAATDLSLLQQGFIDDVVNKDVVEYCTERQSVITQQQQCFGRLVLTSKHTNKALDTALVSQLWCEQVIQRGWSFLPWSAKAQSLLSRCHWVFQQNVSVNLPDLSSNNLQATLDTWLAPFVGNIKNLKQWQQIDLVSVLKSQLDYQQQQLLNKQAPTHFDAPSGHQFEIDYASPSAPLVSLPMQAVYGLTTSPTISDKRIPITFELLSPAKRPIQVTKDLAAFWQGSYGEVQKEMKGRYPKHFWPDDPATAQATIKTKKAM